MHQVHIGKCGSCSTKRYNEHIFFRPSGPAVDTLKQLRKSSALNRFRVQTRGRGECTKLIIGIGQVHPVLSGKFERFQARRIANVQAEIFTVCRFFSRQHHVMSFGQEGYSGQGPARLPPDTLAQLKSAAGDRTGVKRCVTQKRMRLSSSQPTPQRAQGREVETGMLDGVHADVGP